jgi:hypothetical protein
MCAASVAVVAVLHGSRCRPCRDAADACRRGRLSRRAPVTIDPPRDGSEDWALWEWDLELSRRTGLGTAL